MSKLIEEVSNNNEDRINTPSSTLCKFCSINPGLYSCPKCEEFYCSLKCYKHEKHFTCTNEFYSEQVQNNMTALKPSSEEQQIIIEKLKKIESDIDNNFKDFENDFDYHSLIDNFEDLALDDYSFNEIWSLLPPSIQKEFEKKFLTNQDSITLQTELLNIIPDFKVWWNSEKIIDIDESENEENQFNIKILQFPMFKLTKIDDCIKYHIIYTIFIYTILYRYLLGDFNDNQKLFRKLNLEFNPILNPKSKVQLSSVKELIEFYLGLEIEEIDSDFQANTISQGLKDVIQILEEETNIQLLFSHLLVNYQSDSNKFVGYHNINFQYSMAMNINFKLLINKLVKEIEVELKYY